MSSKKEIIPCKMRKFIFFLILFFCLDKYKKWVYYLITNKDKGEKKKMKKMFVDLEGEEYEEKESKKEYKKKEKKFKGHQHKERKSEIEYDFEFGYMPRKVGGYIDY